MHALTHTRTVKMIADERHVKKTTKERIIERELKGSWFLAICKPLGHFTRFFVKYKLFLLTFYTS